MPLATSTLTLAGARGAAVVGVVEVGVDGAGAVVAVDAPGAVVVVVVVVPTAETVTGAAAL